MKKCCDMKGFLSFTVLRLIRDGHGTGEEIRQELKKRKGSKPSPGTIYPVLKMLHKNCWIEEKKAKGKERRYKTTQKGKKEIENATKKFIALFFDMEEEFEKWKR
mgnify:CR=1 FL=1